MTQVSKTKNKISQSFQNEDFESGFLQLLTLPDHEVVSILSKKGYLKKEPLATYFWGNFCIERHEKVFSSSHSIILLNWYLRDLSFTNKNLDAILSECYSEVFVIAIQRNRAFLDQEYLQNLIEYKWPHNYSVHLIAWNELYKRHTSLQRNISLKWNGVSKLNIESILGGIICWVDKTFYADYTSENHERTRQVYNYAVSYIFSNKLIDKEPSEDEFQTTFFQSIKLTRLDSFLESIADWIEFETTTLTTYCFDPNCKISLNEEGILHFDVELEEVYLNWKKDNDRYLVNEKRYYLQALEIYKYQGEIRELNIPKGNSEIAEIINHNLYIKHWQSALFLQDLHIRNFTFEKRSVHACKLVGGLMSFSVNRHWRYVESMRTFLQSRYPWRESLIKTLEEARSEGVSNFPMPYIYMSQQELSKIYEYSIPELEEQEIKDLIAHFSFELKPERAFDPFKVNYSVLEIPFIRIGKNVFTPTSLFAGNTWFYSFAQYSLKLYAKKGHTREQQETSAEMEIDLVNRFKEYGWNAKLTTVKDSNLIDGDIDVFVDDGKTQLLIQLKRTMFKLDLATNYKDSFETDLKASGQLNSAIQYLYKNENSQTKVFDAHEKWIVTTSFEGVLTRINGCLKVNYFDLIWALKHKKFDSLEKLKFYIEEDGPFKDCMGCLELP